jgi:hypothetical protein
MPVDVEGMTKGPGAASAGGTGLGAGYISDDRECVRCGYPLRGLETNGKCPECGAAITSAKTVRHADNLVDAPIGYIRLMAVGMGLLAGTIVFVALLLLVSRLYSSPGTYLLPRIAFHFLLTGAAGVWCGAAWIVTLKRPRTERIVRDPILDNAHIRLATRVSQGLPPLAALVSWGAAATGSAILGGLAGLLLVGALFGLVPLGVFLSAMADWAGETGEGGRLRAASWCIAVLGTLELVVVAVLLLGLPFAMFFAFAARCSSRCRAAWTRRSPRRCCGRAGARSWGCSCGSGVARRARASTS